MDATAISDAEQVLKVEASLQRVQRVQRVQRALRHRDWVAWAECVYEFEGAEARSPRAAQNAVGEGKGNASAACNCNAVLQPLFLCPFLSGSRFRRPWPILGRPERVAACANKNRCIEAR